MQQNKMTKITSRCGLDCDVCPAHIVTIKNDDSLRQKTADDWNKKYNAAGRIPITKDDINCLGCLSLTDSVYKHCKECGVRICAIEKGIKNCGECAEYKACQKISSLHKYIPEGKEVCDNYQKEIISSLEK